MTVDTAVGLRHLGTALVTGASVGIGLAFARRLAADGHDLVLVARDRARLDALAGELAARHGIAVEVLAADLADPAGLADVVARVADPDRPIDLLVNNAGDSISADVVDTAPTRLRRHLALNVGAVQALTRAALPGLRERGRGAVLNVSSVNGFVALPGAQGLYGAGKAYVTALSQTLAADVAGSGARVMALCPGLTRTDFGPRNGLPAPPPRRGPTAWEPEDMVDAALADLARGRERSIPGARFKLTAALGLLMPYRPLRRLPAFVADRRRPGHRPAGTAVVTGATSGPGRAFAERLAADGGRLVLVDRDGPPLRELVERLSAAGADVEAHPVDLADRADREGLIAVLRDRPVDLLVVGADARAARPAGTGVEVGVVAVLDLARAALPGMLARDAGAVVVVTGSHRRRPDAERGGADAFARALARALTLSLLGTGVQVMAVVPGRTSRRGTRTADRALADLARRRVVSWPGPVSLLRVAVARAAAAGTELRSRTPAPSGSGSPGGGRRTP